MGALRNLRRKLKLDRKSIIARLPSSWQFVLRYRSTHKSSKLLLRPKTFTQKLWYKIHFDRRPSLTLFADKVQVREYVRQKVGPQVLIKLLATADRPEDIRFDQLPRQFIMKANHGCGYNRIVYDLALEDEADLRSSCRKWLSENYDEFGNEWAYKNIQKKILVETLLDAGEGKLPEDYKFFVFNGKVCMIQVDVGRFTDHRRDLFTRDWKKLDASLVYPNAIQPIPKPASLTRMLEIAESLGADIDFVRVDLYEVNGCVFFGELTNYPGAGNRRFDPEEIDQWLGTQWRIEGY